MSGQIKVNQVQLGDSATATQNFVLQTNVDGTAKLARGNVGATSQDIFTIDTGGGLNVSSATASGHVVNLGLADARYSASLPNFTASTTSALISATLGTGKVDFRNAVLTNGATVAYNLTSTLTLAMNSTAASLGATTAVATSLIYAIVYNAGSPQLAVCNLSGGLQLDETNLITTTAIGSGSTAANVWYSTTAISTASQYRIVGRVDATWTSGTGWSSPTLVQPVGVGEAMAGFSSLGYGQIYIDVTGSRVASTTYYNATGKPIQLIIGNQLSSTNGPILTVGGVVAGHISTAAANVAILRLTAIVPAGASYSATGAWDSWVELR